MSAPADDLRRLLAAAGVIRDELGLEDLERLWSLVGATGPHLFDEFVDAVVPGSGGDELGFRVGQWKLDLAITGVRASVLTALVAGVLIPQGFTDFAVGFVTAVLPSVLEIERVALSAGDHRLLVEMRSKLNSATEDELYASLGAETRAVINRYDFADFVQRLREAGFATQDEDGLIRVRAQ